MMGHNFYGAMMLVCTVLKYNRVPFTSTTMCQVVKSTKGYQLDQSQ